MSKSVLRLILATALFLMMSSAVTAQMTVSMGTLVPSGQPVGTKIVIVAGVSGNTGTPAYQFLFRPAGGTWRVLRDFAHWAGFEWAPIEEGAYELLVIAGTDQGESAAALIPFVIAPLAGLTPTVTATDHPLVAIYSAPDCFSGQMQVRFRRQGSANWQRTPLKPCVGQTVNFYIAGMRADTTYIMQHILYTGAGVASGPFRDFRTGVIARALPTFTQPNPPDIQSSFAESVLLTSHVVGDPSLTFPVAQDLAGNPIWYYDKLGTVEQAGATIVRPVPGGTFLIYMSDTYGGHVLREIDLAGNIVRETNAFRIGQQLAAMGTDPSTSFHHDAVRLANGRTLVLLTNERIVTDLQGPGDQVVIGDMIAELDENFQVTWFWNAFDHFDVSRVAIGDPVCESEGPGCPPLFLGATAKDWMHSNSLHYVVDDGNIIMNIRNQDAVIKINYQDGAGSGEILWELGPEGDFSIDSADPYPWFSHAHDAEFENGVLTIFDNGNVRVEQFGGNSRGQAFVLDEDNMTASLILNADLGGYSFALGSAQRLANGNYHFNSGFQNPGPISESIEVQPNGTINSVFQSPDGAVYRSFRLQDMYRP